MTTSQTAGRSAATASRTSMITPPAYEHTFGVIRPCHSTRVLPQSCWTGRRLQRQEDALVVEEPVSGAKSVTQIEGFWRVRPGMLAHRGCTRSQPVGVSG